MKIMSIVDDLIFCPGNKLNIYIYIYIYIMIWVNNMKLCHDEHGWKKVL